MSETAKARKYIVKYCKGEGLDIGCGTEKVVLDAIGIDFSYQYDLPDHPKTAADYNKGWDEFFIEHPDKKYDYIFSSHLLEDYEDPFIIIDKWMCHLKKDGYMIMVLPIEELYQKMGTNCNQRHKHNWKGVDDFIGHMPAIINVESGIATNMRDNIIIVDKGDMEGEYSFYLVFKNK